MRHALACLVLAAPALPDVLNVRGPQPDYQEIKQAINAAAPGDVVRVWPGQYEVFTVTQSVTIVRATINGVAEVEGTIRIKDLGPGAAVELNGIAATGADSAAMIISDCLGSVRLRECELRGKVWQPWEAWPGLLVMDSSDVAITSCQLIGGSASYPEGESWGGNGLDVWDSNVSIFNSTCQGQSGTTADDPGESGSAGGHGIYGYGNGKLWIAGCTLIGGDGSNADPDPDWWTGYYGDGGAGGWGYYGSLPAWLHDCTYEPGWGGYSWGGSNGPNGQDHNGTARPGTAPQLRSTGSLEDDASITLRAEGKPGAEVWVRIADGPGYRFDPARGPFLVETAPAPAVDPWLRLGTIGPSGVLLVELPNLDLPAFEHQVLHFQGVFLKGKDYFGSMTWSVLMDDAW